MLNGVLSLLHVLTSPENLPLALILARDELHHVLVDLADVLDDLIIEFVEGNGQHNDEDGHEVVLPIVPDVSLHSQRVLATECPADAVGDEIVADRIVDPPTNACRTTAGARA